MIAILAAFAGALLIAVGTELADVETVPRPLFWAALTALYPLADGLAMRFRARFRGLLRLLLFLLHDALITYPLGYAAWGLHELGWMDQSLPSLGLLLLPPAFLAAWASPWLYLRQREPSDGFAPGSESYSRWLRNRLRILLVPASLLAALIALTDRIESSDLYRQAQDLHPGAPAVLCAIALVALFAVSPLFVLLIWPTTPFPEGELRQAMEAATAGAGLGRLAIRVWDERTRHVINACAVGLCRGTRGVIFTTGILRLLDRDQLFAVFCHELAHHSRRHLPALAGLAVAFLLSVPPLLASTHGLPLAVGWGLIGIYTVAFWLFLFGAISRRFETEADCVAAESAGVAVYASALEWVQELTGSAARRNGWRHLGVGKRLEILAGAAGNPKVIEDAKRVGCKLRGSIWGFLALSAALFVVFPALFAPSAPDAGALAWDAIEGVERYAPTAFHAGRRAQQPGPMAWLARDAETVLAEWRDRQDGAREAIASADASDPQGATVRQARLEIAVAKARR